MSAISPRSTSSLPTSFTNQENNSTSKDSLKTLPETILWLVEQNLDSPSAFPKNLLPKLHPITPTNSSEEIREIGRLFQKFTKENPENYGLFNIENGKKILAPRLKEYLEIDPKMPISYYLREALTLREAIETENTEEKKEFSSCNVNKLSKLTKKDFSRLDENHRFLSKLFYRTTGEDLFGIDIIFEQKCPDETPTVFPLNILRKCLGGENITGIKIRNYKIVSLPKQFSKLSSLQHLTMWGTGFSLLPDEIRKLENLKRLSLIDNKIRHLSSRLENFFKMKTLELNGTELTSLTPKIKLLKNLNCLNLSSNKLLSLPEEIGDLTNLNELFLNNNNFPSLSPKICKLPNLKILSLSKNKLSSLPPEIKELKKLQILDLDDNHLISVPKEIKHLTKLVTLMLSKNRLTLLPVEICSLYKLEDLDLRNNPLESLPKEITKLTDLGALGLSKRHQKLLSTDINTFLASNNVEIISKEEKKS